MVEPNKYFKLSIHNDEQRAITMALRRKGIYSRDLLYRAFAIDRNCDKAARIEEILERGTDRTSDEKRKGYTLTREEEKRVGLLKPSEYLYIAQEREIKEQLDCMDELTGDLFVSVYDGKQMRLIDNVSAFAFIHKERPQDALVALIELEYKPGGQY